MIDLVILTFWAEIEMFRLQIRSIERFVPLNILRNVIVIWNSDRARSAAYLAEAESIIAASSGLGAKVRLVLREDIAPGNQDQFDDNGWRTQQALKLASARFVESNLAIIMDTKNHFIREVDQSFFISHSGKPYLHKEDYTKGEAVFYDFLKGALEYFSVPFSERFARNATPTITPFPAHKEILLYALDTIESREGVNVVEAFLHPTLQNSTEFLLYYAAMLSRFGDFNANYEPRTTESAITFFSNAPVGEGIPYLLGRLRNHEVKVLAVHRSRFSKLTNAEVDEFTAIWTEAGLFANGEEVEVFLRNMGYKES